MKTKSKAIFVGACLALATAGMWITAGDRGGYQDRRLGLKKTFESGNFREAYDGLRNLAIDPGNPDAGPDLNLAVECLNRLGRQDEQDDLREAVIAAHKSDWQVLETAALSYANTNHFGFIVAGKFYRGHRRGGGQLARYVNAFQRDRVRALQLMRQAMHASQNEQHKGRLAEFYVQFGRILANQTEPFRLQFLTDIDNLPDYEEGYYRRGFFGQGGQGAPVDDKGNPILHQLPESFEKARSDGERWRWTMANASRLDPKRRNEIEFGFAQFLWQQFGVQTMAHAGFFPRQTDDDKSKTGTYALHTLSDRETIARLATGIKRFDLPDEFNCIKIFKDIVSRGRSQWGEQSRTMLAQIFEDRRQYSKAAEAWKDLIGEYGPGPNNHRQQRLDQIVGNWGRFEPTRTQSAGAKAVVDYRFRNGDKVSFEAYEIKVGKLLDDVKAYLASNPGRVEWEQINIGNIGHRLVERGERQYLGAKVAAWKQQLQPRPNHVDDRITITTPLVRPGAYLLRAQMAGGNISRIIVWVSDTVILKKTLDGKVYYHVADAVTGRPIDNMRVEFFGWKQEQVAPNRNQFRVVSTSFRERTDPDGQIILGGDRQPVNYQWLITARMPRGDKKADRFAYLGFTNVWYNRIYDPEYNQAKIFTITDRPVYRPQQTVQFKAWVRHAKYDQADTSSFAGHNFRVRLFNPKGEKIVEKTFTADEYGGFADEYFLPRAATLGVYSIQIDGPGQPVAGGGTFRVEEYKKPEFDVSVDAPKEPVRLGEKIEAVIKARYYFGAPVTQAKVKYKVLRTNYSGTWYPRGRWDWFYGTGYWWFAADALWYPGFLEWGCLRPRPPWWGVRHEPPEVVLENEVPIGPDGTVKVLIDTLPARELHGDHDQKYAITAEVVDESRRTIVGTGDVLVARKPFQVFAWADRGHYRPGETVVAGFRAQTLDQKPVQGKGVLTLYRISYSDKNEPVENAVASWNLGTNDEGHAEQKMKAGQAGQYRLSFKLTDSRNHTIEGGYLFVVRGQGFDGKDLRFNDIELITDKKEYAPGDKVKLLINTNRTDGVVLLFVRPTNGIYQLPRIIRLHGKSTQEEIAVVKRDMPNFFIEAVTISNGVVHNEVREVVVPPEKRVLNVAVMPSQKEYKPGQKATVKIKLTDYYGEPFVGTTTLSIYDKSVEYISGGTNVPEIKEFFWKWRRHHHPQTESSLDKYSGLIFRRNEISMSDIGIFGAMVVEEMTRLQQGATERNGGKGGLMLGGFGGGGPGGPPMAAAKARDGAPTDRLRENRAEQAAAEAQGAPPIQPTVRKNFADTAFWKATLTTNERGEAEVSLTMPENLTAWKIRVWAMGHGTKVGQGDAEVTTKKDLLVRLQAPRFFVQKDEVVLSANVHNYLKGEKKVQVSLELDGGTLSCLGALRQDVVIPSNGEKRVDWRVKVVNEGEAVVRMKAITDEDADAMEMRFPCFVHGMLKMESYTGVIRPEKDRATVAFNVPLERRINETRLEIRYSPSLAGAMVDALPYLVDYPYGCTEQTLNRFLPTVITHNILKRMNLNLKEIQKHRTNLNSQEIGDDKERMKGWKRCDRNPVFDESEVEKIAKAGVDALAGMQVSDGGWGWFSGFGERSFPHTTAVVVHGLQLARENGIQLPQGMLERGVAWLQGHQEEQVRMLLNAPTKTQPWKEHADSLDALVYMILVDAGVHHNQMQEFLYRDRNHLAVYAKALLGLALFKEQQGEKLAMVMRNINQYLVEDEENQTAYLRLPASESWWNWYGSENEANAYYLKLISLTNPKDVKASRLVKYLLNNRKHATYWNSTRDTAVCIEAMADFMKASGEDRPDMTVEIWLDGRKMKEAHIDTSNLFTFDNKLVLVGDAVESGKHALEIKRRGTGPVYFNAYLTNFTLEDFIRRAGLEIRVNRKVYKLTRADAKGQVAGSRGQALEHKIEKYIRTELKNLATLKSGDLVEVELEIDSKNDYEYLVFEDMKAAGFEPMEVRSGYTPGAMGAYMELRDEKVCFFVRHLPRGKHSISYRLRAEIPGQFSALPTRAYAMYAPELKGNSDEIKLVVLD
jgi:uncharacterized protein YfaS (alpha-2-macroglobulin family)